MKQKILWFVLLLLVHLISLAQEKKIKSNRPSETIGPDITEIGTFIAEIGFQKEQESGEDNSYFHPEAVMRYGVSKRFELRARITSETQKYYSSNDIKHGLKPVEIGFKANFLEAKGWLPNTSLLTQIGIPGFASKDHKEKHVFPMVRLLFENELSENLKLDYNVGPEWDGEDINPEWFYSIEPELEIGKKWEVFVEVFGHLKNGHLPEHVIDGGLAYYPTNNIKLDIYSGKGISKAAPDYFISAGISFWIAPKH